MSTAKQLFSRIVLSSSSGPSSLLLGQLDTDDEDITSLRHVDNVLLVHANTSYLEKGQCESLKFSG